MSYRILVTYLWIIQLTRTYRTLSINRTTKTSLNYLSHSSHFVYVKTEDTIYDVVKFINFYLFTNFFLGIQCISIYPFQYLYLKWIEHSNEKRDSVSLKMSVTVVVCIQKSGIHNNTLLESVHSTTWHTWYIQVYWWTNNTIPQYSILCFYYQCVQKLQGPLLFTRPRSRITSRTLNRHIHGWINIRNYIQLYKSVTVDQLSKIYIQE